MVIKSYYLRATLDFHNSQFFDELILTQLWRESNQRPFNSQVDVLTTKSIVAGDPGVRRRHGPGDDDEESVLVSFTQKSGTEDGHQCWWVRILAEVKS